MPFTISHVALARPLDRVLGGELPILALAAGTMAPDFEYFLRGRIERSISHLAHGVLLVDLPLGLLFLAALTWLVVPGILTLLPDGALHLGPGLTRTFTIPRSAWTDRLSLARIAVAIMIGAGSHLVWDEFTHGPAAEGRWLGWLNALPFSIGQADFALYSVFQWISSVAGLAVLAIAADRWFDRQPRAVPANVLLDPTPSVLRRVGWVFVGVVTVGFGIQNPLAFLGGGDARPSGLLEVIGISAVWALTGLFLALALFGAAVQLGLIERWQSTEPGPNTPVGD